MRVKPVTQHGTLLKIFNCGVLLSGESGIGKSELALALIERGHLLIADDAPLFERTSEQTLIGTCPPALQNLLEVRDLGAVNVVALFGEKAIAQSCSLDLMIKLTKAPSDPEKRLMLNMSQQSILDVTVPVITLSALPGRHLPLLVEAAVKITPHPDPLPFKGRGLG